MKLLLHFEIALLIHYFLAISLIYIGIKKEIMADLSKVFQQFANTANEGEKAVLDTKKVKRALKVDISILVVMVIRWITTDKKYCIILPTNATVFSTGSWCQF